MTGHWSTGYVGLPWVDRGRERTGLDCWGLVRLVYAEQLGIDLPAYSESYASTAELAAIDAAITSQRSGWARAGEPAPFDVALHRWGRYEAHVGVMIDGRRMLHMMEGVSARIERIDEPLWNRRLVGFFRPVPTP